MFLKRDASRDVNGSGNTGDTIPPMNRSLFLVGIVAAASMQSRAARDKIIANSCIARLTLSMNRMFLRAH